MRIGIDLLWVKPQKSGGIESYIRNLLDGFYKFADESYEFLLFVAKDNAETFEKYFDSNRFQKILCNTNAKEVGKRILWENINLNKQARKYRVDLMFSPVYSKPIFSQGIKYVTTIHDLQALHYPEYFSKLKYYWLKFAWKRSAKTSDKVIAISNFVKEDIIEKLCVDREKVKTIYNPIVLSEESKFEEIIEKYQISSNSYFYTVSSMHKHKNLMTLLNVMKEIKYSYPNLPQKLLISGIGGYMNKDIVDFIEKNDMKENIILTGFVSNEERNTLYINSAAFLFSSIFEGFGMPVIEAMIFGTRVITTNCASLKEVTENLAVYVEDPFDINEWIKKIISSLTESKRKYSYNKYDLEVITKQYLSLFRNM